MNRQFRSEFYEGSKKTLANRDFWNANSDFETTASRERDTLRARARWIHENNPIIANIDRTIAVNVIGGGIKFQFKAGEQYENLNKEVEEKWEFAKESLDITRRDHFDEMCRAALKQRFMDGEVLLNMPYVKENGETNLQLQMLEVDRFALGVFSTREKGFFYDGIETNEFGRPIAYHLTNDLFQDVRVKGKKISSDVRLNAENVLYYYKRDNRASQYRGVSEYKQVITDIKNFAAQMRATIEAARSRANISYAVKKGQMPRVEAFAKDLDSRPIETINGTFVYYLNHGDEIQVLDPKIADDNFDAFVRAVVRLVAAGRSISYEMAFRDYAQVNYSSGRMSWLQDYKLFDEEFAHFTRNFYKPIFMRWLELECLKGNFKNMSYNQFLQQKAFISTKAVKLYSPKREWIDPLKEAKAIETELANKTITLEEVYARRGLDYEEALKQISKESELMKSLGINPNLVYNKDDKILEQEEQE